MPEREVPLIKETRIHRLINALDCFRSHQFNREEQRNCVLRLYNQNAKRELDHMSKSIFRGMVIPSLRALGWIKGFGDSIKPSPNGSLILEGKGIEAELGSRVTRAVILDLDQSGIGFLGEIGGRRLLKNSFVNEMIPEIAGPSTRQRKERILHWLTILEGTRLISQNEFLEIRTALLQIATQDTNPARHNLARFARTLLSCYRELSRVDAIVEIATLRREVGLKMLSGRREVLTETTFDGMLRMVPLETEDYIISLGKPMGSGEGLLRLGSEYFRTIYIEFKTAGGGN